MAAPLVRGVVHAAGRASTASAAAAAPKFPRDAPLLLRVCVLVGFLCDGGKITSFADEQKAGSSGANVFLARMRGVLLVRVGEPCGRDGGSNVRTYT